MPVPWKRHYLRPWRRFISHLGHRYDGNPTVYRTISGLYADVDQDGYTSGAAASQCVGNTSTIGGRRCRTSTSGRSSS